MTNKVAYSVIKNLSVDQDERVIEGIMTTPTPDRVGDVVEPMGVRYALPLPLLWQHNHDQPIGNVEYAAPNAEGIPFRARIAKVVEPGALKDRVDEAWQSLKYGLIRAVSIGFGIDDDGYEIMKDGGWRFTSWELRELSLVTIPANAEATINVIRSIDTKSRAASGKSAGEDRQSPLGVTSKKSGVKSGVKALKSTPRKENTMANKTISEQIAEFDATKAQKQAQLDDMLAKSAESGETLGGDEEEAYDTLEAEIGSIDKHLARLARAEASMSKSAKEVPATPNAPLSAVKTVPAVAKAPKLAKGTGFARFAMAMGAAGGSRSEAAEIAKRWDNSTPEVGRILKAAVAAGTTTAPGWAAELVEYENLTSEFIEILRPQTIIGKMAGLTRVPFNVKIPGEAQSASTSWVGEGKPTPLSAMAFNSIELGHYKTSGIVPLTEELVRMSNPAAEQLVMDSLIKSTAQFLDVAFLDPTRAGTAGVSPASITNGAGANAATGTTADALRSDLGVMMRAYATANLSMADAVLVCRPDLAISISLMRNALGQKEFADLNVNGGTLEGIPVMTSNSSPAGQIAMISQSEVLFADDGEIMIDVSREASVEMETAPADPADATTVMTSFYQNHMVGIRATRHINWMRRRGVGVQLITGAAYS